MRYRTLILVLLLSGAFASGAADIHEMIMDVSRQISITPDNPRLYLERSHLYRQLRDWPSALTDLDRAVALDASLTEVDFLKGSISLEAGLVEAARTHLDRFLLKQPERVDGLLLRSRVLELLAEPAAALRDLDAVIAELRPVPEQLYIDRDRLRDRINDACPDPALKTLAADIREAPYKVGLVARAIELELSCNRWEAALGHLNQLPEVVKKYPKWLVMKAEILKAGRQSDAAREALLQAQARLRGLSPQARSLATNKELAAKIDAELGVL